MNNYTSTNVHSNNTLACSAPYQKIVTSPCSVPENYVSASQLNTPYMLPDISCSDGVRIYGSLKVWRGNLVCVKESKHIKHLVKISLVAMTMWTILF
jgi:hypothetical protein